MEALHPHALLKAKRVRIQKSASVRISLPMPVRGKRQAGEKRKNDREGEENEKVETCF